jgi:hypothetical protein
VREYRDPDAQKKAASTTVIAPASLKFEPEGFTRMASPPNPSASPTSAARDSRFPNTIRSRRANHSGTVAMINAVSPEPVCCSAHATSPLPPRQSAPPTIVAATQFRAVGRSKRVSPRHTAQPYISAPATMNRVPAMRNGGRVRSATRMAR